MIRLLANPFEVNRLNEPSDFRPEWDVPSINAAVSEGISREIEAVRTRAGLEPGQKIVVVLGPAGYGKTHVFGRIQHQQEHQIAASLCPR